MKKSYLVGALLLLWSVAVWGQTPDEGFASQLKNYVEARVAGEDAAFTLVRINDVYKQGDDAAQSNYREAIKQAVATSLRANENRQALELINLYDFLVPESTNRAPELYLIEGTIHSRQNDSVRLKESIAKLEALGRGETMLQRLNGYLEQMRNYVPADKYLEGYWVSDVRNTYTHKEMTFAWTPFCKFRVDRKKGATQLVLLGSSPVSEYWVEDPNAEQLISRMVIPFSVDSLYICWSSEQLRNFNPEEVASYRNLVRETSAQAVGTLSQRHRYSSSEQLAGGLLVNIAEMGINSLISSLSNPKKTVTLTQARLKRINDRLYRGTLHYYQCRVSTSGAPQVTEWNYPVTFHRWDEASNVLFFWGGGLGFPIVGHNREEEQTIKQDKSGYYVQWYRTLKELGAIERARRVEDFDTQQYRQLEIYNQRLLDPSQTPIIVVPEGMRMCGWLGATVRKVSAEEVAANKWSDDRGLWIESMAEASPAFVAGFREGDVIRTVGGVAVNTPEELAQKIKSYPAGAELTIELMRKDKLLSRIVRLSYQFTPKDE